MCIEISPGVLILIADLLIYVILTSSAHFAASVCIIGGGVAGLTAAFTAAEKAPKESKSPIILLEGSPTLGGRVQSDKTEDGYTLDRGFAVFIEEYPVSKNARLQKERERDKRAVATSL